MKKNSQQKSSKSALRIVGHRGAAGLAPENTLAAIRKGLEHGADELEIDVRVTKDNIVILNHDSDVRDQTTARLPVHQHSYAELQQHKPDLATLQEAIEAVDRQLPLQIEVKSGEPTIPVVKVLQIFLTKGWQASDFLIASKSQRTLMELHRALPGVPTVVIEPFSGVRASLRARQLGTKRLSMRSWWLWRGFIGPMSRRGYQLYAYSINDPARAKRWAGYGLAGIITDFPDRFSPLSPRLAPRRRAATSATSQKRTD